jgi:single-strand DNA-binding protein
MSDINSVVIGGRLVADPEVRSVGDAKVCELRLASSRVVGKQKTEKTVFINVNAWNGLGETCAKFLKKGAKIHVVGSLRQDNWEKDGEKKTKFYIDASEIEFGAKPVEKEESEAQKARAKNDQPPKSKDTTPAKDDEDLPF